MLAGKVQACLLPLVIKGQVQNVNPFTLGAEPQRRPALGLPRANPLLRVHPTQTCVHRALQAGTVASVGQRGQCQEHSNLQQPTDKSTSAGCFKYNKSGTCEVGALPGWRGLGEQGPRRPKSRGAQELAGLKTDYSPVSLCGWLGTD